MFCVICLLRSFFFQAEDGIRAAQESRGLGCHASPSIDPFGLCAGRSESDLHGSVDRHGGIEYSRSVATALPNSVTDEEIVDF